MNGQPRPLWNSARKDNGQTLVEVALILPMVILAIVVFAQVWCLCHNACVMQESVSQGVRLSALAGRSATSEIVAGLKILQEMKGQTTIPSFRQDHQLIQPWRSFPGFATVKTPGYLTTLTGSVILWKGRWGLPPVRIQMSAAIPTEPPVPEER